MRRSRFSIPVVMALLAAGSLFVGAPTPAGAAEYGPFELTDISQTASWSGALQAGPIVPPDACVPDVCDIVEVDVRLPEGVWGQPGGMLVATQTPGEYPARSDDIDCFDLYVYHEGRQVAKATSIWSTGDHAVWLEMTEENPGNGVYTVVVAWNTNPACQDDPPAYYDGLVSFDRGLTVKREELRDGLPYTQSFVAFGLESAPSPAEELWPDLVPTTPGNFHIETGNFCLNTSACDPSPARQPSCYAEETAGATSHDVPPKPGPLRCLRLDQGETNVGDGPFELHIYPGKVNPAGQIEVYQRIYRSDGSVIQEHIGGAVFHPNHHHFHYTNDEGWWGVKLYERLPNGQRGREVEQAKFASKGICPLDVVSSRFGQRGAGPQAYGNEEIQTCPPTPHHRDPNDPTFPNGGLGEPYIQAGVSVGWSDFYNWFNLNMYIDITTVPDGKYIVVTRQDPGAHLFEKSRANNTAMACVEISGITARACDVPDLQVTSLSASNTKGVRQGEKVTVAATVSNTGDGTAAASSTELSLDGSRMPGGLLATPPLAPGESAILSLDWDTRGVKGEHTIRATADTGRMVEESNEENNAREVTVMVRGNKIRNPSFEESSNGSSPDHWSSSGETAYEPGGSDGVRSVSTEPGGSWTSEAVAVEAGASYDASVVASGAGGTLLVQQLTADGSVLSTEAQALLPSEVFTLTSLQLTALPGAAQARVVLVGGVTGKTTFDDVGLFSG